MVDPALEAEFGRVLEEWQALGRTLAELAERLAMATLMDVLPGTSVLELFGGFNDGLRALRTRRVVAADGNVLFDANDGHANPDIEAAVDEVDTEYLDLLLDLTGDAFMGTSLLTSPRGRAPPGTAPR